MKAPESNDPSAELFLRARTGDADAFGALFERYRSRVESIARTRLGRALRSRFSSSDVAQETFIVAFANFSTFEYRSESSLINWLAKIAENAVRARRRRRSIGHVPFDRIGPDDGPDPDAAVTLETPLEICARNEESAHVETCLGRLSDRHREVIIHRDFLTPPGATDKVPWRDVASELGFENDDAARATYRRARARFSEVSRGLLAS